MASTKCTPSRETVSPHVAHAPLRPCCLLPWVCPTASPEHHQALRPKLQTVHSTVYRILVVLKPSPFFPSVVWGTDFLFSPLQVFSLFLSLSQATFGGVLFLHNHDVPLSPHFSFSLHENGSLLSRVLLSPSSPLCTAYLPSSFIQVMQIVLLILRSIS